MASLEKVDYFIISSGSDIFVCDGAGGEVDASTPSGQVFGGDLVSALRELFEKSGFKRNSRILILSDSLFSQRVELSSSQISGLSEKELEAAIYYEIEPFVDVVRENAAFAYRCLSSGIFDVALAPSQDVASLEEVVRQGSCRFVGLSPFPQGGFSSATEISAILDNLRSGNVPILTPSRKGLSLGGNLLQVASVVSAIFAILCLCDWLWLSSSIRKLQPRVATCERMAAANSSLRREIASLRNQARAISANREAAKQSRVSLATYRDSWLTLLERLASSSGNDIVINRIVVNEDYSLLVECVALSPSSATMAMSELAKVLAPSKWVLSPNLVEALPGGLSFSFSFDLVYKQGGE